MSDDARSDGEDEVGEETRDGGESPTGDGGESATVGAGEAAIGGDAGSTVGEDAASPTGGGGASTTDGADWTPDALRRLRDDPVRRRGALAVAALVGIGAAWVHWLGLFVAGALVGLASRDLPRAVVAGLAVGVLVLVLQILAVPAMSAGEFLALTPPSYVAVAAGLGAPLLGSLLRGVL